MFLYRICTENRNFEQTIQLVAKHFDGFTVLHADGFWKGQAEHSLVIEILPPVKIGDGEARTQVEKLAHAIRKQNKQQTIMIQRISVQYDLI
jgi:hypothetical protein